MPHTDTATRISEHKPVLGASELAPAEVCPYCGDVPGAPTRCLSCGAHTDPLSKQASQNEMGPWFVRDETRPFRPGCRFETIERWVRTGRVDAETVIRGPSTNQHWMRAGRVPGVARLLGWCHACRGRVEPTEVICGGCGTGLETIRDRQHLGLSPVRAIPGRHDPVQIATSLLINQPGTGSAALRSGSVVSAPVKEVRRQGVSEEVTRRVSRLERQLKRANSRAVAGSVAAVAFAVLFVLSMVFARSGEIRRQPAEAESSARSGAAASPGMVEEFAAESISMTPVMGGEIVDEIERLLAKGGADDLEQARRLIDSAEAEGESWEVVEKLRTRLERLTEGRD